ncbi:hypothetical protein GCM10011344_00900 [Dokdonia pacifica]|uniref:PH domain-containing protein n=1 Tax=Dokdonia pacifica TaxID=1627892 RepID=A0A239CYA2_9FLAO|nr:hypothetical protein [Dokdonia pacifica]GGG04360.1 hypothetical protein GCM10011344_00900 [Dokdonia pacifica]SNS25195.1 hypothetical protein SAMN06265376_10950 [Dokdonia pacifica]
MTFDIIQPAYFENLKPFAPYYKWITGIGFSILYIDLYGASILPKNKTTTIILISVVLLSFILYMLNNALFTRIGNISFENEKVIIIKNDIRSEFLVSDINVIKISGRDRKQYTIKATPLFEEIIELQQDDLTQLKNFLTDHHIDYKHHSIMNWLKNLSFIKNR